VLVSLLYAVLLMILERPSAAGERCITPPQALLELVHGERNIALQMICWQQLPHSECIGNACQSDLAYNMLQSCTMAAGSATAPAR
jgi:hypothetical protein